MRSALGFVVGMVLSGQVFAAPTPRTGSVSEENPVTAFNGSLVKSDPTRASCNAPAPVRNNDPAPSCDVYTLTVTVPADYASTHPDALVKISMPFDDEDYDLFLLKGNNDVDASEFSNPEVVRVPAGSGTNVYTVQVLGYIASGGTYLTTITLLPDGEGGGGGGDTCTLGDGELP